MMGMELYSILLTVLTEKTIEKTLPLFKRIKKYGEEVIDTGLEKYYYKMIDKNKEIKTLLHRQPRNFYEIYFPSKLTYGDRTFEVDDVEKIFAKGNYSTVIGDAGSGKSMLVRHLFLSALVKSDYAPILVLLRDLGTETSDLKTYISNYILGSKILPSNDKLHSLLEKGSFIFFLDGYDEIKTNNKKEIINNLESFISQYPNNKFILTSRPYSNIEHFGNFHNFEIAHLSKRDQTSFINQQIDDQKLIKKIIASISEDHAEYIESFLENPLLLTLYIITYSRNAKIPNKKYHFYRRVFDVLFTEHDSATKVGYERELKTGLSQECMEKILRIFSSISYFESKFNFDKDYIFDKLEVIRDNTNYEFKSNDFIDDIKISIGLWLEDSGIYSFSHRSLQEYFAASYLKALSEDEKTEIYKTIMKRIESSMSIFHNNMRNFLDLCYEMDETFFIKNAMLPMIEKLLEYHYDTSSGIQYETFFPTHVRIKDGGTSLISIDMNVSSIYENLPIDISNCADVFFKILSNFSIEDNILYQLESESDESIRYERKPFNMKEVKYLKRNKRIIKIIDDHIEELEKVRDKFIEDLKNVKRERKNIIKIIEESQHS